MRGAEVDPFMRKFGIGMHKRHEIARKRGLPALDPRAHDQMDRYLHKTHVHGAELHGIIEHFVKRMGIGIFTLHRAAFLIFLT